MGLANLATHRLRSALTIVGVMIGVGAITVMVSLVEAARRKVLDEFRGLGSDLMFITYSPGRAIREEEDQQARREKFQQAWEERPTLEDMQALEQNCDQVAAVAAEATDWMRVSHLRKSTEAQVRGVAGAFAEVRGVTLAEGRFLTNDDALNSRKVCVLGAKVRARLFGSASALGQRVAIGRQRFTVVGLAAPKGSAFFQDPDRAVYVTLQTYQNRLGGEEEPLSTIYAKARSPQAVGAAADQIWAELMRRHRNREVFRVDTQVEMLRAFEVVVNIFRVVLGGIAGLSLLVGGIGIMNIMLVSVVERTREIGLRKAVGARRRDILLQFLSESVTLSGAGGVAGLGLAALLCWGIGWAVDRWTPVRLDTSVPLWAALTGMAFSAAVGTIFGLVPALRAARLDPIVALRVE